MGQAINVFVESGKKRTFAGAVDWPGWCRRGKDEETALQALFENAPRYWQVLQSGEVAFTLPESVADFVVQERHPGNATTNFGASDAKLDSDERPVDADELEFYNKVLLASWAAFDAALAAASGKELRKGPRGGGRDLERIIRHVLEADLAYLKRIGWQFKLADDLATGEQLRLTREAILAGLAAKVHGELAPTGPRGGVRWTARFFVRRVAWHVLDHTWEIEDRIE